MLVVDERKNPLFLLRVYCAFVVITGWAASLMFSLLAKRPVDSQVHVMFGLIVLALFGPEIARGRGGGKRDNGDDK
jgi:hypothetical protein